MPNGRRNHHGLTLLEALVVLAIVAIFSRFAVFATSDWIARQRAAATMHTVQTAINFARQSAAGLNRRVIVCPVGPDGCGRRDTWHNGFLVFADRNGNARLDDDEPRLARLPGFRHGNVRWRSFRNRSYLAFTPRGVTDWQNGHFRYCPADGDMRWARQLVLNAAGRLYASRDADGDGVHEDAAGDPLTAC